MRFTCCSHCFIGDTLVLKIGDPTNLIIAQQNQQLFARLSQNTGPEGLVRSPILKIVTNLILLAVKQQSDILYHVRFSQFEKASMPPQQKTLQHVLMQ